MSTMSSRNVLICGGAGYIGSTLVHNLIKETSYHVTVFDNLSYGGNSLFPFFNFSDRFTFIKGDIRNYNFEKLLEEQDFVVNLIALVGEPICKKFPKEAQEINHVANTKLAKTAEKIGIERFIFASTCSNYGLQESEEMIDEKGELNPISIYAETKVESEKILLNNIPDLSTTILRLATAYGMAARIRFDLLLHELIRDAWTKAKIYVYGGQSWRPIINVNDIAKAIITVMDNNNNIEAKGVFNIGSNEQNFQKLTLAEMVANRVNVIIEETQTKKDPRNYKVSFDKAKKELNFTAAYTPEQSINQIVGALESGLIDERTLFESVNV